MICVIHKNGTSFKGLNQYVLHDKGKSTDERVAWTHTHNLATQDPELGGRIMAATAMDSTALKQSAGEVASGRKLSKTVMHYSLSWHEEERDDLTREQMIEAAQRSLKSLGVNEGEKLGTDKKTGKPIIAKRTQHGDEHQAVIVCHDEGPGSKPHVHIMVNRVHPEHGIALSESNNFVKLSDWALEYRKEQGKAHYCPERVKAAALRAHGYRTRNKRVARNVYDQQEQREAIKLDRRQAAVLDGQRKKAAQLKAKEDGQKKRHKKDVRAKEDRLLEQEKKDRLQLAEQVRKARNAKKNALRAKVEEQADKHLEEQEELKEKQTTMTGKVRASMEAVKSKGFFKEFRSKPINALTGAFQLAFSKEKQQEQLSNDQEAEKRRLASELAKDQEKAARDLQAKVERQKQERLAAYQTERNDLLLQQKMEGAKMRAEWKQLQTDRKTFLEQIPPPLLDHQKLPPVRQEFKKAASPKPPPINKSTDSGGDDKPPNPPSPPTPPPPPTKTREEVIAERLAKVKAQAQERAQERGPEKGPKR